MQASFRDFCPLTLRGDKFNLAGLDLEVSPSPAGWRTPVWERK